MPQLFAFLRAINAGSRRCGPTMNTVPRSSTARGRRCIGPTRSTCLSPYSIAGPTNLCRSPRLCERQKRVRKRARCTPSTITIAMAIALPQNCNDRNHKIIDWFNRPENSSPQ
jgi:hypothetical protein